IEVVVAIDVGDPAALAAREHHRQRIVIASAERLLSAHQIERDFGVRLRRGIATHPGSRAAMASSGVRSAKVVVGAGCHRELLLRTDRTTWPVGRRTWAGSALLPRLVAAA